MVNQSSRAGAGARPVLLRLTQLQIAEQLYAPKLYVPQQAAMAEVGVELWHEQRGQYYLLGSVSSVVRSNGTNATAMHAANIAQALSKALTTLLQQPWPQQLPAAQVWAHISSPVEPQTSFAIETAAELRKGVYRDHLQFRNNEPEPATALSLRNEAHEKVTGMVEGRPYLLDERGRSTSIGEAWGYCDGRRAYVYFDGRYYALNRMANGFYFRAPDITGLTNTHQTLTGPVTSVTRPAVPYEVDLRNGQVVVFGSLREPTLPAAPGKATQTTLVLYCRTTALTDGITVNGQPVPPAAGGHHVQVPVGGNEEVEVCVAGKCLRFAPDVTTTNYLEYRVGTAGGNVVRVPATLGEVHLRKLSSPTGE